MSLARLGGAADWVRHLRLGARMMWRLVPRRRLPVIVSACHHVSDIKLETSPDRIVAAVSPDIDSIDDWSSEQRSLGGRQPNAMLAQAPCDMLANGPPPMAPRPTR